jgi:hypothetical protein
MDYNGFNLDETPTKVASVQECADRCIPRVDCTHFTVSNSLNCFLKSSDAGAKVSKYRTSGICLRRPTVATATSIVVSGLGCEIVPLTNYAGPDLTSVPPSKVVSVAGCAEKCLANIDCTHFSVSRSMNCFLKASAAGAKLSTHRTSGICRPPQGQSTFSSKGIVAESVGSGCAIKSGIDFAGHNLPGAAIKVTSVDDCAVMCMARPECSHFTLSASHKCFLKSSDAGATPSVKKTSGICRTPLIHAIALLEISEMTPTPPSATTTTTLVAVDSAVDCEIKAGTDFKGHNLPAENPVYVDSTDECATLCIAHPMCSHFTVSASQKCYLKSSGAGAALSTKKMSGICRTSSSATVVITAVPVALPAPRRRPPRPTN